MRGGRQPQDADRAAVQFTAHLRGGMAPAHQCRHHAAPVQQQQAAEQVFGVGADIGAAGVDHLDAAFLAGFEVGVVGTHMQAAHGLELGHEIEEFACHHGLAREHNAAGLVRHFAQNHQVVRKFRTVFHTVARLQPGHGFRHQCIKK
eukprot:Amastigsp_a363925_4.p3 type:complete len:147 gc:universal Amastigsp_a363925_4:546-106(-)